MRTSAFINFLFLLLYRHRSKHVGIGIIAAVIVFMLASVLMLSHALQHDIQSTLQAQPDFIVQKMRSGRHVDLPLEWAESFYGIEGVSQVLPRVYGSYYFQPQQHAFTVIGIDPFDTQSTKALQQLVGDLDISAFLAKPNMIIGSGVKAFLSRYYFNDYYVFRPPESKKIEVSIFATLPQKGALAANDLIIMEMDLARAVLAMAPSSATDFALYAPNEIEAENILAKLIMTHEGIRVIQKIDVARAFERLFNYKGGLFLILYTVVLLAFMLVLYQRYMMIQSRDKREIGVLRAVGWSIREVLVLKMMETLLVALMAFMLGFVAAYIYVFWVDAPLLGAIFYGHENLPSHFELTHLLDLQLFSMLLFVYIASFMAAVMIPTWRVAVSDPLEAMR